ncbi:putative disease resistance protein [Camellia lanceoleosa]|uniref:Disease resistance protein n=1 Tax=Camellia lanceoleosa TaxID=1840588 RepID=A0ACC0II56_9ERIC|nr:putative disease resistance protein [Camellia lanceoleosa]
MEKIQEVEELQVKGRFSNGLLIDALPTSGWSRPTMGSFGETTSERNMEKVWECLMDDEYLEAFTISKLQSDIAKALNLDISDYKDETRIASELYAILSRKERPVKVELLTEEEALNLFMSKVEEGQTVLIPEVKEIARKVAKECTGLPLAIKYLGRKYEE